MFPSPQCLHTYFAYGSNLCARQMARRCPDAVDPRPATLFDHGWLINERGVATVAPFGGSEVHGVLWQLPDRDLATLDRAEGVPARYRRDRLIVHTVGGPSPAWIYIDHRIEPGPPRPGYLERILDGARQHDLPHRWIEFLSQWDQTHQPVWQWPAGTDPSGDRAAPNRDCEGTGHPNRTRPRDEQIGGVDVTCCPVPHQDHPSA